MNNKKASLYIKQTLFKKKRINSQGRVRGVKTFKLDLIGDREKCRITEKTHFGL